MVFNQKIARRIEQFLQKKQCNYETKNMMGGLCFMVEDKMACGTHFDKKQQQDLLMIRIGKEACKEIDIENSIHILPMDFTGRPMAGYLFIKTSGIDTEKKLHHWLQLCLDFNPQAKSSKKR